MEVITEFPGPFCVTFREHGTAFQELGKEMYKHHGASAYDVAEQIIKSEAHRGNRCIGEIYAGIADAHARVDAPGAVAKLRSMFPGPIPTEAEPEVMADHKKRSGYYQEHVYGLLRGWGSSDPGAAMAFVDEAAERIASSMGRADLSDQRHFAAREVYSSWAESDPISALLHAADHKTEMQDLVFRDIYRDWAARDPGAAADYLAQGGVQSNEAVQAVIGAWAAVDLDAAARLAGESSATTGGPDRLLVEVGIEVCHETPELAASLYDIVDAREPRSLRLANNLVSSWAQKNPQSAGDWVLNVADEKHRASAFNKFLENFTWEKPRVAYDWATVLDDDDYRARVLSKVAEDQAYWAKEIASDTQGEIEQWRIARYKTLQEEMPDPLTWIQELPPGPTKERVVAGYVTGALSGRPAYNLGRYLENNSTVDLRVVEEAVWEVSMPDDQKQQLLDLLHL
jgi:hypothetical protein